MKKFFLTILLFLIPSLSHASVIFTDTFTQSGTNLLSSTADTGQSWTALTAYSTTLDQGTLTISSNNGIPLANSASVAGAALIGSSFTLPGTGGANTPGTFTISGKFYNGSSTEYGISYLINYDTATGKGLALNVQPANGAIVLYKTSCTSSCTGGELTFTQVGSSQSFSFTAGQTYQWNVFYNAGVMTVTFGGTACTNLNYTDNYTVNNLFGVRSANYVNAVANNQLQNLNIYNTIFTGTPFYADNSNIMYIGNGAVEGSGSSAYRLTLSSGDRAIMNVSGTQTATLNFNISNVGTYAYPDIVYIIDGEVYRTTLTSTGTISISFPTWNSVNTASYYAHKLEVIIEGPNGGDGGGNTSSTAWTNYQGCCFFSGITLDSGGTLLPVTAPIGTIEFDGTSISAAINMLGTGAPLSLNQCAHIGWAYQVAAALGLAPVERGFEGNGLVHSYNTRGVPLANAEFPYVASGIAYSPSVNPSIVVIEFGTNDQADGVSSSSFQSALETYLTTVRTAYSKALIFVVILPLANDYVTAATNAIAAGDANMDLLNYSSLSYTTTDGTHPNVGGAVTIASQMAADISSFIASRGLSLQICSGGGSCGSTFNNIYFK